MGVKHFALLAIATVAIAGCGGDGGTSFNRFEGTYEGTFQFFGAGGGPEESGIMRVRVDSFGDVTGTLRRTDRNETVSLRSGSIGTDNVMRFTWRWSDTNDRRAQGRVILTGNVLRPDNADSRIEVQLQAGGTRQMFFSVVRL